MPTLTYTAAQQLETSFPIELVENEFGSSSLSWGGPSAAEALATIGLTPEQVTISEIRFLWDLTTSCSDSIHVQGFNDFINEGPVSGSQSYEGSTVTFDENQGMGITVSTNECDTSVCPITITLLSGTQIEIDYELIVTEFWTGIIGAKEVV